MIVMGQHLTKIFFHLQVKKVHKTSWSNSDIVVDREVLDQMKKIASSDVEKIMEIRQK